jgi:hypothetical protein
VLSAIFGAFDVFGFGAVARDCGWRLSSRLPFPHRRAARADPAIQVCAQRSVTPELKKTPHRMLA